MANCCDTNPSALSTGAFFSKRSKMYANRFKKGKLEKEQRLLLDGIRQVGLKSASVLDIGCGVGQLHLTLLKEGAARATGVDMAEGMLNKARTFAAANGVADKANYILGDFVSVSKTVERADIAMLDKVVCCYEFLNDLLDASTAKANSIYALTHPAEHWMIKLSFNLLIGIRKLFRADFRPYWHDWSAMRQGIERRGFQLVHQNATFWWNVLVYRRTVAT
jgi:magnesium-protoporphyrin O-methyltransferase